MTSPFGVCVHAPSKATADPGNRAEWAAFDALLARLPKGTPVRVDLLFDEWAWNLGVEYGWESVRAKVESASKVGGPITFVCIPLPPAGGVGWSRASPEDFDGIAMKWARFWDLLCGSLREFGVGDERVSIHLGNEAGAGHPGGCDPLPRGQWWAPGGGLYSRLIAATDWGGKTLVLPSLSFQDEREEVAARERASAGPILRRMRAAKKGDKSKVVAATHVRYYDPTASTAAYAEAFLKRRSEFRSLVIAISGCKECVCPEVYVGVGDTPDVAGALRLLAPKLGGCHLYRIGPGPEDALFQVSEEAFASAVGDATR